MTLGEFRQLTATLADEVEILKIECDSGEIWNETARPQISYINDAPNGAANQTKRLVIVI